MRSPTSERPRPGTRIPRVTLVGSAPPVKGISDYCHHLASALADHTEVEFLGFSALYPAILYRGGSLVDIGARPIAKPGIHLRQVLKWYDPVGWLRWGRRISGHVLHVQWWSVALAPVMLTLARTACSRGIPVVTTIHNVKPHESSRWFEHFLHAICRLSDRVIVHTRPSAQRLRADIPAIAGATRVVPHGPLGWPPELETTKQAACRSLGLPEDAFVLLLFGGLRPYKGIEVAVRAMGILARTHDNMILLIAGADWGGNNAWRQARSTLGLIQRVRIHDRFIPANEVPLYFRAADLALLPYLHFNAQSGVGLTALFAGVPIVASRVGGLDELVLDPESAVPPGDPCALASRIARIARDPTLLRRLQRDSRCLARRYAWETVAETTMSIYEELLP